MRKKYYLTDIFGVVKSTKLNKLIAQKIRILSEVCVGVLNCILGLLNSNARKSILILCQCGRGRKKKSIYFVDLYLY